MDNATMLAQATACVATCLDVHETQAQKKMILEQLIAVATTKLQNLDQHQMTQARREHLRATTTDPHLVRLIDTVEVTCYRYEQLDHHVHETLSLTIDGSPAITAHYNGNSERQGETTVSFGGKKTLAGAEDYEASTLWWMLYHLRSCLGLNETISLATLSAFLKGMIFSTTMINCCIELPEGFEYAVLVVTLEEATTNMTSGGDARTAALSTTTSVEYQCPLQELERLLRVAATKGQGGAPLFKPEDVLSLRLPVPRHPSKPFLRSRELDSLPQLLSTPLAAVLMA